MYDLLNDSVYQRLLEYKGYDGIIKEMREQTDAYFEFSSDVKGLFDHMMKEAQELKEAIAANDDHAIIHEAADVIVLAMGIIALLTDKTDANQIDLAVRTKIQALLTRIEHAKPIKTKGVHPIQAYKQAKEQLNSQPQ